MFCTGKEQLTCNSEKLGCEGCFYFNDENNKKANTEADIKIFNQCIESLKEFGQQNLSLFSNTPFEGKLETIEFIFNKVIARNKELENKYQHEKVLSSELEELLENSVSKSKIEEEFEKMTLHSNCFNLGDMNDLLDRILY